MSDHESMSVLVVFMGTKCSLLKRQIVVYSILIKVLQELDMVSVMVKVSTVSGSRYKFLTMIVAMKYVELNTRVTDLNKLNVIYFVCTFTILSKFKIILTLPQNYIYSKVR